MAEDCELSGQSVHPVAPSKGEYLPLWQSVHMLDKTAPCAAEYLPRAHFTHDPLPAMLLYVPAGHRMHMLDETAPSLNEYLPRSHVVQDAVPG